MSPSSGGTATRLLGAGLLIAILLLSSFSGRLPSPSLGVGSGGATSASPFISFRLTEGETARDVPAAQLDARAGPRPDDEAARSGIQATMDLFGQMRQS